MPPSPAAATAAFARRVAFGAFVGAACRALLVTAGIAAAAQLAMRLAGGYLLPHPAWSAVLAPVALFAWWSARRQRPAPGAAASHLDRRLGLQGLLLCAHEGLPLEPAWQQRLSERLLLLPAALPRVQWRRVLPWPGLALALATVVALLPPPPAPPPPVHQSAVASEVERLTQAVRDLSERGLVPEESRQELEQKLQELQRRLAAGEVPEWRDLDQIEKRIEREELLQAAAEPAGRPSTAPSPSAAAAAKAEATAQQVADAAAALTAAGLLGDLPAELRAMLDQARDVVGDLHQGSLPQDAEALRRLAEAMAAVAAQPGAAAALAGLGPAALADLRDLVERFGAGQGNGAASGEGMGEGWGEGADGDGVGRGGVDRGPGHAALRMTEDAQGAAAAAMALPPGQAAPTEWVPIGSRPIEPEVNPATNTAPGTAGAAGTGGASWQLQLAPRHRAVVQRFFGAAGTSAPPAKDKR